MSAHTPRRTQLFSYSRNQVAAIRESLERVSLPSDTDWPLVLHAITEIARSAQAKAEMDKPLYAGEASKQIRLLYKAMALAAESNDMLSVDMQQLMATELDCALEEPSLLRDSLLRAERLVLRKLLYGKRLSLLLTTIMRAAERVAVQLESAGKVVPLSSPLPARLHASVRDAVNRAARQKRRPFGGRFPHTGSPKEEAVCRAVPQLWSIYEEVTGKRPTIYPNSYDEAIDGYGGQFYAFAKAALGPLRLVPARSLPSAIFQGYQKHRRAIRLQPSDAKI